MASLAAQASGRTAVIIDDYDPAVECAMEHLKGSREFGERVDAVAAKAIEYTGVAAKAAGAAVTAAAGLAGAPLVAVVGPVVIASAAAGLGGLAEKGSTECFPKAVAKTAQGVKEARDCSW